MLLPLFLFIGATAVTILAERMNVPTEWLIVIASVAYGGCAFIAWRPRWAAALAAFKNPARTLAAAQAQPANVCVIPIDSREFKRHLLATYYMHALQYRDMANASDSTSRSKLEDIRNRLNRMRDELKSSSALLSEATTLEFNEPHYEETMLQQQVIENAEHFMEKAHQKWKAWGGNAAPTPLMTSISR